MSNNSENTRELVLNASKQIKNCIKKNTWIYDHMMNLHQKNGGALYLVIGGINTGKSKNIECFVSYAVSKKFFKQLYIISPTIHANDRWLKAGFKKQGMLEVLLPEVLLQFIEQRKQMTQKERDNNKVLMVLDDVLANPKSKVKGSEMIGLLSIVRHLGIFLIVISQEITGVPRILRSNNFGLFLHRQVGAKAIDIIYDEIASGNENKQDFIKRYFNETADKHFYFIDNYYEERKGERITVNKANPKFFGL